MSESFNSNGIKNMKNITINKMLYGGVAGFMGTTIIYPIDTIRTRLQSNNRIFATSLYRGFGYNLSYVIPEKAIKFGVNELYLNKIKKKRDINMSDRVISGGIAGSAQAIIATPAERIKINMQTGKNFITAMNEIKYHGNPFRGLHLTMARDAPFTALFFPLYYQIKQYDIFSQRNINDLFSGLSSAVISTFMVTPIDVVKTQYQKSSGIQVKEIVNDIVKNDGYRFFFRGSIPRVTCVNIMYSIAMATFDMQGRYFNNE